jgi:SAM-dependent methyltransferase
MSDDAYHSSRFQHDPRRSVLWKTLAKYFFASRIPADATVLDLGSGYGDFINEVQAKRRIAIDIWPGLSNHVVDDVEAIIGSVTDLSMLEDGSVDYVFASNLFEHLTQTELATLLGALKRKLSPRGELTLLQPNYRYAYREYFDDYTHVAIYSHISMVDFLKANGFQATDIRPGFLPLTIKGRLPVHPLLIRAYLASPFKPLAKQMLISARIAPDE